MKTGKHLVLILDDDKSIVTSLERLLAFHGYRAAGYLTPEELFSNGIPEAPACLILDHHLGNGITGMQVHEEMQRRGWEIPTVYLTGNWNVRSVVSAMRAGVYGFLTKPVDTADLLEAVEEALRKANDSKLEGVITAEARLKAESLTAREKDIVRLVAEGMLNKEIAHTLGIALVTVKVHRGRAMSKMGAGNAAELARIAALSGLLD